MTEDEEKKSDIHMHFPVHILELADHMAKRSGMSRTAWFCHVTILMAEEAGLEW